MKHLTNEDFQRIMQQRILDEQTVNPNEQSSFHRKVASEMFEVPEYQVTSEQYNIAKRETFLYLYGAVPKK